MDGKPAIQSKTVHGLTAVVLGWALGYMLPKLGFQNSDIPAVKQAVFMLIDLGREALVPLGTIYTAWGMRTATKPITGILKAPDATTPTIAESGGPKPDDPPH